MGRTLLFATLIVSLSANSAPQWRTLTQTIEAPRGIQNFLFNVVIDFTYSKEYGFRILEFGSSRGSKYKGHNRCYPDCPEVAEILLTGQRALNVRNPWIGDYHTYDTELYPYYDDLMLDKALAITLVPGTIGKLRPRQTAISPRIYRDHYRSLHKTLGHFETDWLIVKPRNSSMSRGVRLLTKGGLHEFLTKGFRESLFPSEEALWVIQEYLPSDPIEVHSTLRIPVGRLVASLFWAGEGERVQLLPITVYWKISDQDFLDARRVNDPIAARFHRIEEALPIEAELRSLLLDKASEVMVPLMEELVFLSDPDLDPEHPYVRHYLERVSQMPEHYRASLLSTFTPEPGFLSVHYLSYSTPVTEPQYLGRGFRRLSPYLQKALQSRGRARRVFDAFSQMLSRCLLGLKQSRARR